MRALPATGIGSWPGTVIDEAVRATWEAWDLPYVPELPARGPEAEMLGRTLGLLEVGVERGPGRWRAAATHGSEQRRALAVLRDDLDVTAELAEGYDGPLTLSVAGPYTLLACVDLARGEPMVADAGARRDVVQAHRAAVVDLVRRVATLMPAVRPVVKLDEPALAAVAEGSVASASGLRRLSPVDAEELSRTYRALADALSATTDKLVVHSCAPAPWGLLSAAGVGSLAVDADAAGDRDAIAEHVDGGGELWLGVVPTTPRAPLLTTDQVVERACAWLRPLELGERLEGRLVLSPACGLAGFTPEAALRAARTLREAAGLVAERLFG